MVVDARRNLNLVTLDLGLVEHWKIRIIGKLVFEAAMVTMRHAVYAIRKNRGILSMPLRALHSSSVPGTSAASSGRSSLAAT